MPILERDPWRTQYFEHVACPEEIKVPTEDGDAYGWFPEHRWIYNKLAICESQGLLCGLHGMEPPSFPVFSKPVYNMRGMGAGSRIFKTRKEYNLGQRPGHMWMPMFEGRHVSTDIAVVQGRPAWWRHTIGHALDGGMFDHWTVLAEPQPEIEDYVGTWLERNFQTYTGMVNVETIGARIIEGHLRFSDQWPDLYGQGWVDALVGLYRDGIWDFADRERADGYSVVLFGAHGLMYRHPDQELIDALLKERGITSIQVTFHEDKPASAHSMPPGGFRLAIVNGTDLEACRAARERLALRFWSAQQIVPKRPRRKAGPA